MVDLTYVFQRPNFEQSEEAKEGSPNYWEGTELGEWFGHERAGKRQLTLERRRNSRRRAGQGKRKNRR